MTRALSMFRLGFWRYPMAQGTVAALTLAAVAIAGGNTNPKTAALWLHGPAFALCVATLLRWIDAWPPLGRDREGAATVERAAKGPLNGCGLMLLAATLSLSVVLALTGAAFNYLQQVRGQPLPFARKTLALAFVPSATAPGRPPAVASFALQDIGGVRLRFVFFAGPQGASDEDGGITYVRLSGRLDDDQPWEPLTEDPIEISAFRDIADARFKARRLSGIQLEVVRGAPVAVRLGGAVAHGTTSWHPEFGAACAALTYVGPTFLAGSLVILLRRRLSVGMCKALALGATTGLCLTGSGGTHGAVADLGAGTLPFPSILTPFGWMLGTSLAALGLSAASNRGARLD